MPDMKPYTGKTLVIKYGGNAMIDEGLKRSVLGDIVTLQRAGIRTILVHGGGPEVSAAMKKAGIEPVFVNGLRVTDAESIDIAEMVLSGKTNKGVVSILNALGAKAVGLSGKDASLLVAEKMRAEVDLGFVGSIMRVNPAVLSDLLDKGYLPVVSSIAIGLSGESFNTNADHAAGEIASAVKAAKLIMMTDVTGIYRDFEDKSSLISRMSVADAKAMLSAGQVNKGMIPKVEACVTALAGGVEQAHIIDGTRPHSLLAVSRDGGTGTMVVRQLS